MAKCFLFDNFTCKRQALLYGGARVSIPLIKLARGTFNFRASESVIINDSTYVFN